LPDHDIGYQWLGLTRGQWLSVGMVAFSACYIWFALRRDTLPVGGWKKQPTPELKPRKK
jgi:phosphatidylglycerol---prolipoprotein diacylglyceryl transferase